MFFEGSTQKRGDKVRKAKQNKRKRSRFKTTIPHPLSQAPWSKTPNPTPNQTQKAQTKIQPPKSEIPNPTSNQTKPNQTVSDVRCARTASSSPRICGCCTWRAKRSSFQGRLPGQKGRFWGCAVGESRCDSLVGWFRSRSFLRSIPKGLFGVYL